MVEQVIRIASQPGVKRDGTLLEGDFYVDALWCRMQRGLPRKMGGYRAISKYLSGISRTLLGYTRDTLTYVHAGSAGALEYFYVDGSGNTSIISDKTPGALTADDDNMWQFDVLADETSGTVYLCAQVAPNLDCVCSSDAGQFFTGPLISASAPTEVVVGAGGFPSGVDISGGCVVLHPYCFVFGSNGYVAWSVAGDPSDYTSSGAGNAYITGQKIIRALPLRGGPGNSPSGLFWSADSLVRASYVGGTPIFQFDTLSAQTSVLGAQTIVEYDGIYYWAGTDRFQMFNGVVREIPNGLNLNWFYDNLNLALRQKCFAFKVPRYGEIWWCFPFGDNTECSHAVIYNVRENTWYDTELPNGGRAAALSPAVFPKPMMTGVDAQPYTATALAISDGGSGYSAGDILYASGGIYTVPVEITVTTESAGVITAASITNIGSYSAVPSNPVATTTAASGTDAEFDLTFTAPYRFWIHESGTDEITEQESAPILSYFETADISLPIMDGTVDDWLDISVVEPDFVQSGNMTMKVKGRVNARAPEDTSDPMTIYEPSDDGLDAAEQVVKFKTQRRQLRFYFESNAVGGNYQMGHILGHVQPSDRRDTA